ncbi:MAG: YraN family protein [Bacteroidota bacterium]
MNQHLEVGAQGELIARNFLENLGYAITEQNWRFKHKEIDLIALDKKDLVIVEVKTRRSKKHGETEDFISYNKIKFLAEAATKYIERFKHDLNIRFDIVTVYLIGEETIIEHTKEAFHP